MSRSSYKMLIDEEKQDGSRGSRDCSSSETLHFLNDQLRSRISCSKIVNSVILVLAMASLAVLALFTLVWPEGTVDQFVPDCECSFSGFSCLVPSEADEEAVATKPVTFVPNHIFSSEPSPDTNAAWDGLFPESGEFVLVKNPELYGLGPGIPTELGIDRYGLSMFHQLHCLAILRDGYYAAKYHHKPTVLDPGVVTDDQKQKSHDIHVGHCFDYLRQSIMCAGDTTVEQGVKLEGRNGSTVNGWGVTHQCKSWDDMMAWTTEHHAPRVHSGIV